MKYAFFLTLLFVLPGCLSTTGGKTRSIEVIDVTTRKPAAGVEFRIFKLKRPYWIVGHLKEIEKRKTDENGIISVPEGCILDLSPESKWKRDDPFSDIRMTISVRKTEPSPATDY